MDSQACPSVCSCFSQELTALSAQLGQSVLVTDAVGTVFLAAHVNIVTVQKGKLPWGAVCDLLQEHSRNDLPPGLPRLGRGRGRGADLWTSQATSRQRLCHWSLPLSGGGSPLGKASWGCWQRHHQKAAFNSKHPPSPAFRAVLVGFLHIQ